MLHCKEWRKVWLNVQDRVVFVLMTAATLLFFALPGSAGTDGPLSLERETADPFVLPQAVDVQIPQHVSSDLETGFSVFVSIPSGCYDSRIKVEHLDEFTHRLTPVLTRDYSNCARYSRYDLRVVSLGRLLPGQHEIVVEGTMQPSAKKTFWVNEADLSVSNMPNMRQAGG